MSGIDELDDSLSVAVIGMSGRFPGAADVWSFWENLALGRESIRDVTEEELAASGVPRSQFSNSNYVRRVPVLSDADCFDGRFFNFSPQESKVMDPQQRIFLELCWQALEHSGYRPGGCSFPVGVFAGSAMNTYLLNSGLVPVFREDYLPTLIGNDKDYLATRVAFKLNLRGPAMTIQTACSSSMVAIHTACQSLLNGECDMALAGGSAVRVPLYAGHMYAEGSVFSRSGHVRSFDGNADGTVFGSGAGVVVLKTLEQAREDGDPVLAIIRGSAINNDGASKSDYTAPSLSAQADLIAEALGAAGVNAESVSYIEAHGTGTYLGDPIEIAALTRAFGLQTNKRNYCGVGTAKANIGHLDAAAGVAGIIKVVLSMQKRQLPPLAGFASPNPEINFEDSPFYINQTLTDWKPLYGVRRAGVTSLGIGGTNAHIILDEGDEYQSESVKQASTIHFLPLSAKTESALELTGERVGKYLGGNEGLAVGDVAYSLKERNSNFPHRMVVLGKNLKAAGKALVEGGDLQIKGQSMEPFQSMFLFSGQGSQHAEMGAELFNTFPEYRSTVEACCSILDDLGYSGIRNYLVSTGQSNREVIGKELSRTENTQPALFVIEYALAKLWNEYGVIPDGMLGHSIGEYVAAALSGVFSLSDALAIVAERGRLMQSMQAGWMMAVSAEEADLESVLPQGVSIAVENGAELFAIGGPFEALDEVTRVLDTAGLPHRKLLTSHAFHTAMMDPILEKFEAFVGNCQLDRPKIPFVSNVTGEWISAEDATDPAYWARHIRSTVRFNRGLGTLTRKGNTVAIEVGPGQALTALARQYRAESKVVAIPSLPRADRDESSSTHFCKSLARYWVLGGEIQWPDRKGKFIGQRVGLPGYAFDRTRHWPSESELSSATSTPTEKLEPVNTYIPSWTRSDLFVKEAATGVSDFSYLLLSTGGDLETGIIEELNTRDAEVFVVHRGDGFTSTASSRYTVNPNSLEDFSALFKSVEAVALCSLKVINLWNVDVAGEAGSEEVDRVLAFDSLIHLYSAAESALKDSLNMMVVTCHAQRFGASETVRPVRAMVEPACRALSREYPDSSVSVVDIESPVISALLLFDLCLLEPDERAAVVFRNGYLWRRSFESVDQSASNNYRPCGTYFITGGLGGIGVEIAAYWAKEYGCNMILMSRRAFPSESVWKDSDRWNELTEEQRFIAKRFCEATSGRGEIEVFQGDVCEKADVSRIVEIVTSKYGSIKGVIHAAGGVSPGLIADKDPLEINSVILPKLTGTDCLIDCLRSVEPDFVLLFSSVRALQGPMGLVDYSAANAYLDAVAENEMGSVPIVSVNWPGWKGVGMLSTASSNAEYYDSISVSEGMEILASCLGGIRRRIVVSRMDSSAIHSADEPTEEPAETGVIDGGASRHLEGFSEAEKIIYGIWKNVLGTDEIGAEDDFFELGGSSLLAAKCLNLIRDKVHVKLTLRDFIAGKTLKAVASLVEQRLRKN